MSSLYSLVIEFYKAQYVMGIRNLASVCSSGAPVCFVRDRGVDAGVGGGGAPQTLARARPARQVRGVQVPAARRLLLLDP